MFACSRKSSMNRCGNIGAIVQFRIRNSECARSAKASRYIDLIRRSAKALAERTSEVTHSEF
jgi:hypothetical protein